MLNARMAPSCSVPVDDHVAAEEQDEDEADLGQVLDQGREAGPQVGILDVAPLHLVGRGRPAAGAAAPRRRRTCTTRTPLMFSSTTVATSARRDWMIHDTGKSDFRILTPTQ